MVYAGLDFANGVSRKLLTKILDIRVLAIFCLGIRELWAVSQRFLVLTFFKNAIHLERVSFFWEYCGTASRKFLSHSAERHGRWIFGVLKCTRFQKNWSSK